VHGDSDKTGKVLKRQQDNSDQLTESMRKNMYRRTLIITTLSIASLVVATFLGAITPGTGSAMAQETESPISSTAEHLGLGDRYETDLWELEIQDVFLTPSEHRADTARCGPQWRSVNYLI
jgi:hypothetical protein